MERVHRQGVLTDHRTHRSAGRHAMMLAN
jgi:hypothetical protein